MARDLPKLPLPASELPASIQKFGDPAAPMPARMMAAKGLVPVKGSDLVSLLCQLSADPEGPVRTAAEAQLKALPDNILLPACEAPLHAAIAHALARRLGARDDVLERLVQNATTADSTVELIAKTCSERISEIIAVNQRRLLGAKEIIEALYMNPATRMSTADRLVELAARNGLHLSGVPTFEAHVEAIRGQLLLEPSDEPAPEDITFREAQKADAGDDAIDRDRVDGTESVKETAKPLHQRVREMNIPQKLRFAVVGDAAARSLLVRDNNRLVAMATINSPRMTETEAAAIAHSKEVGDDVLRAIGRRKEWLNNYEIKKALVFNPKTPVATALTFIGHLRQHDVKALERSRNVPTPIRNAARQRSAKQNKRS